MLVPLKMKALTKLLQLGRKTLKEKTTGNSQKENLPIVLINITEIDLLQKNGIDLEKENSYIHESISHLSCVIWLQQNNIPHNIYYEIEYIPSYVNLYSNLPTLFYNVKISSFIIFAKSHHQILFELAWKGNFSDKSRDSMVE